MFEEGMSGDEVGMYDHEDALGIGEVALGMNAHEGALGINVLRGIFHVPTRCKSGWFHLGWRGRFAGRISPFPHLVEEAGDVPRECLPQSEELCCRNLPS